MVRNTNRPMKRHLVRWTPEMDTRLLLTIQSQCNIHGVQIPWETIGPAMGEGITGGACIQHMAKLRVRMVQLGLPVPPPLRRGGGTNTLSGPSTSRSRPPVASTPTTTTTRPNVGKRRASGKVITEYSDDDDVVPDYDSDPEYGKPLAKRKRTLTTKRSSAGDGNDIQGDGFDQAIVEEEDKDGSSRVGSGASFLSLGDGAKVKEEPAQGDEKKSSLVVALGAYHDGHAIVKKQIAEDPDDIVNSSETETEIDDEVVAEGRAASKTLPTATNMNVADPDAASVSTLRSSSTELWTVNVPSPGTVSAQTPFHDVFSTEPTENNGFNSELLPSMSHNFDEAFNLNDFSQPEMFDNSIGGLPSVPHDSEYGTFGDNYFGNDGMSYAMSLENQPAADIFHYGNQTVNPNVSTNTLPNLSNGFQSADGFQGQQTTVVNTTNLAPTFGANQEHLSWPTSLPQPAVFDGEGGYFDDVFNHGYFGYGYTQ